MPCGNDPFGGKRTQRIGGYALIPESRNKNMAPVRDKSRQLIGNILRLLAEILRVSGKTVGLNGDVRALRFAYSYARNVICHCNFGNSADAAFTYPPLYPFGQAVLVEVYHFNGKVGSCVF